MYIWKHEMFFFFFIYLKRAQCNIIVICLPGRVPISTFNLKNKWKNVFQLNDSWLRTIISRGGIEFFVSERVHIIVIKRVIGTTCVSNRCPCVTVFLSVCSRRPFHSAYIILILLKMDGRVVVRACVCVCVNRRGCVLDTARHHNTWYNKVYYIVSFGIYMRIYSLNTKTRTFENLRTRKINTQK